jgi:hypothetical protein
MRFLALLLLLLTLAGCASSASTEDEMLMGTADAAIFLSDSAETVFWDFPKILVWDAPKGLLYDLPREGYLSLSGKPAQVEALIEVLEAGELPIEKQVAISEELQSITGLPLQSVESWQAWWSRNSERPAGEWTADFTASRIELLTSPDYFHRASAIEDLRAIYGTTLGYDPKFPAEDLRVSAEIWRERFLARELPAPAPGPF